METLVTFLSALNQLTPIGVIALLGLAIFFIVWKNPLKPTETAVAEIRDNHLHEVSDSLKDISDTLRRIEVRMSEEFAYLRARVNGK